MVDIIVERSVVCRIYLPKMLIDCLPFRIGCTSISSSVIVINNDHTKKQ